MPERTDLKETPPFDALTRACVTELESVSAMEEIEPVNSLKADSCC
ncbi:hypothetical protein DOFOFD_07425 [Acetobacteraceae bacterium EV16P]|uniref:Uncharacterized protein n=1 Tax=Sorlinia euscelidii TaxID=3081148 RepID=A0ABU7U1S9_9PROT